MTLVLDRELKIRQAASERELWEELAERVNMPLQSTIRVIMNAAAGDDELFEIIERARKEARIQRARAGGTAKGQRGKR